MSRLALKLLLLALFVELFLVVIITRDYYYTIFLFLVLPTIGILTLLHYTGQSEEKKGVKRRKEILALRLLIAAVAILFLVVVFATGFPPYCSWVRLFAEGEDILWNWGELYKDDPSATLIIGISTAIAIITGRIVCGWVCPVGFMQDYLKTLNMKSRLRLRRRRIEILDKLKRWITSLGLPTELWLLSGLGLPLGFILWLTLGLGLLGLLLGLLFGLLSGLVLGEPRITNRIDSLLRKGKYLALAILTLYVLVEVLEMLKILEEPRVAPPTEQLVKDFISNLHVFFNEFLKLITLQGITILGLMALAVLIASIFVPRVWCRYACPYAAFLNIVGRVKFLGLRYNDSCRRSEGCRACLEACPMEVEEVGGSDCTMCGECIGHCPWHAIDYTTTRPQEVK